MNIFKAFAYSSVILFMLLGDEEDELEDWLNDYLS